MSRFEIATIIYDAKYLDPNPCHGPNSEYPEASLLVKHEAHLCIFIFGIPAKGAGTHTGRRPVQVRKESAQRGRKAAQVGRGGGTTTYE